MEDALNRLRSERRADRHAAIGRLTQLCTADSDRYAEVIPHLAGLVRNLCPRCTAASTTARAQSFGPCRISKLPAEVRAALSALPKRPCLPGIRALVDLSDLCLSTASLRNAALPSANFSRARLDNADLSNACLHQAQLREASAVRASFAETCLVGADLMGADLTCASLWRADLSRAELLGTRLDGADLRDAQGLRQSQLDWAFGNVLTQLPQGLEHPSHWLPSHPALLQPSQPLAAQPEPRSEGTKTS